MTTRGTFVRSAAALGAGLVAGAPAAVLAADSASDGRYAFLLVAPPLAVTRGVGTPINPYALK